jgi:hypothetical protein
MLAACRGQGMQSGLLIFSLLHRDYAVITNAVGIID